MVQAREQYLQELDLLINQAEQDKAGTLSQLRDDFREYQLLKACALHTWQACSISKTQHLHSCMHDRTTQLACMCRRCCLLHLLAQYIPLQASLLCLHMPLGLPGLLSSASSCCGVCQASHCCTWTGEVGRRSSSWPCCVH